MKRLLIAWLTFSCYSTFAQYQINPEIRDPAVLVQFLNGSSGSGFYFTDSANMYLITARHVLFGIQGLSLNADTIDLISYRSDVEKDNKNILQVSLVSALKEGYLVNDQKNDIAIIKIASLKSMDTLGNMSVYYKDFIKKVGKSIRINGWMIRDILKLDEVISGSDIFIVGYPKSLGLQGKFDLDRPLFRKGIVAGKDFNFERIIGDGAVYFGNSGGMVLGLKGLNFYLIGLVSEYIPYNDVLVDLRGNMRSVDSKNSGYSVIIPMDHILIMIKQIQN